MKIVSLGNVSNTTGWESDPGKGRQRHKPAVLSQLAQRATEDLPCPLGEVFSPYPRRTRISSLTEPKGLG